ncbi:hypothetical protein ACFDR9_005653, partial [Janthinobacterium sp. CG_23.3]
MTTPIGFQRNFVTVQPLCGKRDRITVEGPEQNLKHAMALLA